jgi:hypothetical protein
MLASMDIPATLTKLGIDREDHRVLALLPLVHIAWADGTVQSSERTLIVRTAREMGWLGGTGEAVLERWLAAPPTDEEVRLGTELLAHLARSEGEVADAYRGDDLHHLLLLCEDVGRAAGRLFGLRDGRSPEELRALETIAAALDVKNAKGWRRPA